MCGYFNVPHWTYFKHERYFETGPSVYSPYPRRLESLTIWWCYYKGSTFSSVIWRPWVVELTTSRVTARCSTNWATGPTPNSTGIISWSDVPWYEVFHIYEIHVWGIISFRKTQAFGECEKNIKWFSKGSENLERRKEKWLSKGLVLLNFLPISPLNVLFARYCTLRKLL